MFEALTLKIQTIFQKLKGYGKLSEKDIQEALREVRRALLEADVHYKVAKDFVAEVEKKALGQDGLRGLTPAEQLLKIVYEELTNLLGGKEKGISFSSVPTIFLLVGLQGSGKTTVTAKIAKYFKGKRTLLVSGDPYRPAAFEQLKILGERVGTEVFSGKRNGSPLKLCLEAREYALSHGHELVIIDTAGRLHIDEEMMKELEELKKELNPQEILLVLDGMTGQDAVKSALEFERRLGVTGIILTKLDGDTRGGAALSIRAVTGKPIKYVGVGEKLEALEPFYPERMASRILGMGDLQSLLEKAEEIIEKEEIQKIEEKLRKASFTFDDFLKQLRQLKKMGPLTDLLEMIPGLSGRGLRIDDIALVHVEAIINSMTKKERAKPQIIDGSRRRRIALGSGTSVQEVNQLLKQFDFMMKMMKEANKGKWSKMLPRGL